MSTPSRRPAAVALAAASLLAALACGSTTATTPTSPTLGTVVQTTTITITASGVTPNNIEVTQGARVLIINNDAKAHNMTSDPHPDHGDCPPLNTWGLMNPGQQRESGNLVTARACGFHDHDDAQNIRWQGRITVK